MTSQTPPPPTDPHPPSPAGIPPGGPQVGQFFDRIRSYGAVRPDDGRWAAGVVAALARRWGLDPLLVRGAFVLLTLFGGFGLFLYGLGWLFLPHPDGRIHAQEVLRGVVTAGFIGGVLCVLADAGGGWAWGSWPLGENRHAGGGIVGLAVIGLVAWWFFGGRRHGGHGPGSWGPHGGTGPNTGTGGWQPGAPYSGPGPSAPTGPAGSPSPAPEPPAGPGAAPFGSTGPAGPAGPAAGPVGPAGAVPPYGTPPVGGATTATLTPAWAPPVMSPSGPSGPSRPAGAAWTPPRVDRSRPLHSLTLTVLGAALLAAGAVLLWERVWGTDTPSGAVAAAVALGVVALGILLAGALGRRSGGLAPIGILLAIVALAAAAPRAGTVSWAGDRTWTPTTVTGTSEHALAVGNARLDLSKVVTPGATASDPAEIDVSVGLGHLTVVTPAGVAVRVLATAGAGNVENEAGLAATTAGADGLPAARRGGDSVDLDVESSTAPVLLVHAQVGVGNLSIVSANG